MDNPELIPTQCNPFNYGGCLASSEYCPYCLGDVTLSAAARMRQFLDRPAWQGHLDQHNERLEVSEAAKCPHPRAHCDEAFDSAQELRFHLQDVHCAGCTKGLKRSGVKDEASLKAFCSDDFDKPCQSFQISADMQRDTSRKGETADDEYTLTWMPMQSPRLSRPLKKSRTTSHTLCPSLISSNDSTIVSDLFWSDPNKDHLAVEPYISDADELQVDPPANDISLEPRQLSASSLFYESLLPDKTFDEDNVFSQYLRSPSPGCLSLADANHGSTSTDLTVNGTTSLDCRYESPNKPKRLRLRLRVGTPKLRITLWVTDPTAKGRGKRRHQQVRQQVAKA